MFPCPGKPTGTAGRALAQQHQQSQQGAAAPGGHTETLDQVRITTGWLLKPQEKSCFVLFFAQCHSTLYNCVCVLCRYQRECADLSQWLQSALERLEFWNTQAVLVPQELESVRDHLAAFLVSPHPVCVIPIGSSYCCTCRIYYKSSFCSTIFWCMFLQVISKVFLQSGGNSVKTVL